MASIQLPFDTNQTQRVKITQKKTVMPAKNMQVN